MHATSTLLPGQTLQLLNGDDRPDHRHAQGRLRGHAAPRQARSPDHDARRIRSAARCCTATVRRWCPLEPVGLLELDRIEGSGSMNEHNPDVATGRGRRHDRACCKAGTTSRCAGCSSDALEPPSTLATPAHHPEAARVLVEECETYDFYHNAFRGG